MCACVCHRARGRGDFGCTVVPGGGTQDGLLFFCKPALYDASLTPSPLTLVWKDGRSSATVVDTVAVDGGVQQIIHLALKPDGTLRTAEEVPVNVALLVVAVAVARWRAHGVRSLVCLTRSFSARSHLIMFALRDGKRVTFLPSPFPLRMSQKAGTCGRGGGILVCASVRMLSTSGVCCGWLSCDQSTCGVGCPVLWTL